MDPSTLAMLQAGSSLLKGLNSGPAAAPPPPQRADGYAIGGQLDAASQNWMSSGATGGATGGAYGGAFSQANVDGSNWTVSTGKSTAVGGGTSGGNGGLSPTLTSSQGGVNPGTPFSFSPPLASNPVGGNNLTLVGFAVLAYLIVKKG